jgi:CheY-like chemotaxis protein
MDITEQPGGKAILVVDDIKAVREVIVKVLTLLGHRVLAAENPQQAIALLDYEGERVNLVLTDVVMPNTKDGDFCRWIKYYLCQASATTC